jgi:hypothetical protein
MWYLIIGIYNGGVIIPEKYPTYEACKEAMEPHSGKCIKAPTYNCMTTKNNGDGSYSAVPSFCYPPIIDNMPKCSVNPTTGKLECN